MCIRDRSELVIKEIDLAQVSVEQTWTVKPELPEGVTNRASDTAVKITLRFSGLVTKKFIIPCSAIERQNDVESLSFAEQSVEVTVRGKPEAVNALKTEDIHVAADMTGGYDPTTKRVQLTIQLPAGSKAGAIGEPYSVAVVEVAPTVVEQ